MRSVAWCAGKKTACHGGCPWHAVWGGLQVWRACRCLTFCQCSAYTWYGPRLLFLTVGDWEAGCFFFNDNTDNRNNRKNGRNRWMSRSDIQHRQRKLAVGSWEAGCVFFNDNTDNIDNGSLLLAIEKLVAFFLTTTQTTETTGINGRNGWMSRSDMQHRQRDYLCNRKKLLLLLLLS